MDSQQPKIVVLGGGTGSSTLLRALKHYTQNLTAIINMTDDGGSTGVLRNELGVLPPGDIRQSLVALSQATPELQDLFSYRFDAGSLHGHSFGNLFLSATEKMSGNFSEAVKLASEVLQIVGQVVPVTLTNSRLTLELDDQTIIGEHVLETMFLPAGTKPALSLQPTTVITPEAQAAIAEADMIVIAPGNLYISLVPVLLTSGMTDSLQAAKAPLVYVANLVNKPQHTSGYGVHDYAAEIERFLAPVTLDYVLYNLDEPQPEQLKAYALEGERPVAINQSALDNAGYIAIGGHFVSHQVHEQQVGSPIKHSLIRHDAESIAKAILDLCQK